MRPRFWKWKSVIGLMTADPPPAVSPPAASPWTHSRCKRLLDVLAALLLLLILWPLIVLIAAGIWLNMGRPLFFCQQRPGKGGVPFLLVKFRTLRGSEVETESPEGKIPPTRFAAFLRAGGLDELPELWNILKGDMSFVGPRPLLMRYLDRYSPEQARRHLVRPGLTGWAQVKGRNAISWEERLKLDVDYVERAAFGLDLRILLQTILTLLKREGITEPGEFTGESKNIEHRTSNFQL